MNERIGKRRDREGRRRRRGMNEEGEERKRNDGTEEYK
jgi:hypothetical protein